MWILSIATIPHIRLHMCRQIDLRLRHVGPRCGPTARPKRATARQLARPEFRGQPASMILTRVQSTRPTAPGVKITLGPRNSLVRLSARPRGRSGWRAQIARPAPRRLPSALRRGKASPQRGNEEKRALAAGEAASRVRRPAEALLRPTVRRLGCGTPARRGGGASPTTYRGMCRARGAGRRAKTRGCGTTRPKKGEGRAAQYAQGARLPRPRPQGWKARTGRAGKIRALHSTK